MNTERLPDLGEVSFKECLLLGMRAERRCVEVFLALSRGLGRREMRLSRSLCALAAGEEEHARSLAKLDREVACPLTWRLDETAIAQMLGEELFPVLFAAGPGGGPLEAAFVRTLVRAIEGESARFYRAVAGRAPDHRLRAAILEIAASETDHQGVMG